MTSVEYFLVSLLIDRGIVSIVFTLNYIVELTEFI